jgi:hypothetical protein
MINNLFPKYKSNETLFLLQLTIMVGAIDKSILK